MSRRIRCRWSLPTRTQRSWVCPTRLWKQRLQFQRFAFRCPVVGSGLGTRERVAASSSSSSNPSPIEIAQVGDIQASHRQALFFERTGSINDPSVRKPWALYLSSFELEAGHAASPPLAPFQEIPRIPATAQPIPLGGRCYYYPPARLTQSDIAAPVGHPGWLQRPGFPSPQTPRAKSGHMAW
jgi:hypothetical protein